MIFLMNQKFTTKFLKQNFLRGCWFMTSQFFWPFWTPSPPHPPKSANVRFLGTPSSCQQHCQNFMTPPPNAKWNISAIQKISFFEPLTKQYKENILLVYFLIWTIYSSFYLIQGIILYQLLWANSPPPLVSVCQTLTEPPSLPASKCQNPPKVADIKTERPLTSKVSNARNFWDKFFFDL